MSRISEFQPPDIEWDIDAKLEAWFDQQERNGYAVISHAEWKDKLNEAALDGYAEGRAEYRELMSAVETILNAGHLNQEDLARLRLAYESL